MNSRRWWALGALVLSVLVLGFDMTILNVALPTLGGAVHASNSQLQWIVDAYVLVFAGLLLPAGALGDRYGRKRLLLIGDRKSTRLNSSHRCISYAVFCLKKKK